MSSLPELERAFAYASDCAKEAAEVVEQISILLAGRGPAIQSAVIADLLSLYLAGMPEEERAAARALFDELVEKLLPHSVAIIDKLRAAKKTPK